MNFAFLCTLGGEHLQIIIFVQQIFISAFCTLEFRKHQAVIISDHHAFCFFAVQKVIILANVAFIIRSRFFAIVNFSDHQVTRLIV